jgi:hypothetical protein
MSTSKRFSEFIRENGLAAEYSGINQVWYVMSGGRVIYYLHKSIVGEEFTPDIEQEILEEMVRSLFGCNP